MSPPCRNVEDIVSEVRRIIEEEKVVCPGGCIASGFSVHGDSPESRRNRILLVSVLSPMAGFLLASVHLEWIVRRAILSLGHGATKDIKAEMKSKHGLKDYKTLWRDEVVKGAVPTRPRLPELIQARTACSDTSRPVLWTDLIRAMNVRHTIVHGRECTAGVLFLRNNLEVLLNAADAIASFVKDSGGDVYATIRRRKRTEKRPKCRQKHERKSNESGFTEPLPEGVVQPPTNEKRQ